MKSRNIFFSILILLLLAAVPVLAQDADNDNDRSLDVQLFRPSIFGGPFVSFDDPRTLGTLGFHIGALVNYTNSLLTDYEDDDPNFDYISELYTGNVLLSLGTFSWLSLGVDVPLHYVSHRVVDNVYNPALEANLKDEELEWDFEIGDIRTAMKFGLLRQDKHWIGVALIPFVDFPTGKTESFLGEGRYTGGGKLAIGHDFGVFNLGVEGGYLYRAENDVLLAEVGNAYQWGAGISRDFDFGFGFSLEYTGNYYNVDDREIFRNNPMEVLATLRYRFGEGGPRMLAGAGPGVSTGVGAPAYRILGGLDYTYTRQEPTQGTLTVRTIDQNGQAIGADLTIEAPDGESFGESSSGLWSKEVTAGAYAIGAARQGYEPAKATATLPVKQETVVVLTLKEIAKPKPTILSLIVTDSESGAKLASTVIFDRGADKEKSVDNPTGALNQEWAPGAYTLLVRAADHQTRCFDITVKENQTTDIEVKMSSKLKTKGQIHFKVNSAELAKDSFAVLDDIVKQIKSLCEFTGHINIEGHTSSEGSNDSNRKLSQRRAESVRSYLVGQGIPADKLEAVGYGEEKPIADNNTDEGRVKNRRVEFVVQD